MYPIFDPIPVKYIFIRFFFFLVISLLMYFLLVSFSFLILHRSFLHHSILHLRIFISFSFNSHSDFHHYIILILFLLFEHPPFLVSSLASKITYFFYSFSLSILPSFNLPSLSLYFLFLAPTLFISSQSLLSRNILFLPLSIISRWHLLLFFLSSSDHFSSFFTLVIIPLIVSNSCKNYFLSALRPWNYALSKYY